jgi:hypothetical protein
MPEGPEKKPDTLPMPEKPERELPQEAPLQNPHPTHVDLPHEEPVDDPRRTVASGRKSAPRFNE